MPSRPLSFASILAALVTATASPATANDAHIVKLQKEKVVVFKDGYCLVVKRGSAVTDDAGHLYLEEVPDAVVLGSFWATPKTGRLINMTAGWAETEKKIDKEVACSQKIEILEANLGRSASIELGDKSVHSDVIRRVLARKTSTALTDPLRAEFELPVGADSAFVHRPRPVSGNRTSLRRRSLESP